jgi:hypothetical protein
LFVREEVDGSILGWEISSLLDGKLVRWSTASCALALVCRLLSSEKQKKIIVDFLAMYDSSDDMHLYCGDGVTTFNPGYATPVLYGPDYNHL